LLHTCVHFDCSIPSFCIHFTWALHIDNPSWYSSSVFWVFHLLYRFGLSFAYCVCPSLHRCGGLVPFSLNPRNVSSLSSNGEFCFLVFVLLLATETIHMIRSILEIGAICRECKPLPCLVEVRWGMRYILLHGRNECGFLHYDHWNMKSFRALGPDLYDVEKEMDVRKSLCARL
jgi:hypothetical protein